MLRTLDEVRNRAVELLNQKRTPHEVFEVIIEDTDLDWMEVGLVVEEEVEKRLG
jgi:hypothetical protein